jgi:hypothetical protein
MAEAQKARWAKIKGESEPPSPAGPEAPKRQISEDGRKRMIAATKKRWKLQKAKAAKSALAKKAAPKKSAVKKAAPAKAAVKKVAPVKKAAVKRIGKKSVTS